ncbi:MAG: hypothetical protein LCH61_08935 [Proteobacteria bacterium]|nr:hypothetical protein [Pseudomonadota bacterium]MCA0423433.1 hypothetical protein [Pseudomonadota bacterium]
MLQFPESKPISRARQLTDMWNRISRQHMSAGSGCGCGFGGLILQAADFELDIVEFVIDDAKKEGRVALLPFIHAVCNRGPDRYSILALLQGLDADDDRISDDDRSFALERLANTLGSIDSAHGQRGFACD